MIVIIQQTCMLSLTGTGSHNQHPTAAQKALVLVIIGFITSVY